MAVNDITDAAIAAVLAVPPTIQLLASNPARAVSLYASVDPLTSAIVIALAVGIFCYVAQILSGNCSWVDKLWSLVPQSYVIHFTFQPLIASGAGWNGVSGLNARAFVMTALSCLWGMRLTYNFWRKDGYTWAGEDYRWPELRTKHIRNPILWQLFSFLFIAMYQNLLLLSFVVPAWAVTKLAPVSTFDALTPADWGLAALYLLLLITETIADQQQWNYQNAKYAGRAVGTVVGRGFCETGLWRYSRHPNFFCEVSMWWTFYAFSVAATAAGGGAPQWLNVSILGTILLSLLFHGSTTFTESITGKKYPLYASYQATTSRLVPWLPAKPARD